VYLPSTCILVVDQVLASRAVEVVSRVRMKPGAVPMRFQSMVGKSGRAIGLYAPRFGTVEEVDEHRVTSFGREPLVAYALLLGASTRAPVNATIEVGAVRVQISGREYHILW
jgi:hypothetical protein